MLVPERKHPTVYIATFWKVYLISSPLVFILTHSICCRSKDTWTSFKPCYYQINSPTESHETSFGCFCMDPRTSCRSRNVEVQRLTVRWKLMRNNIETTYNNIFSTTKNNKQVLWMVDYWLTVVICFFLIMADSGYLMRRHQFNHYQKKRSPQNCSCFKEYPPWN